MLSKEKTAELVAEFIATFTLVSVILGISTRSTFPFFIAAGAGLTLGLMVILLGSVSGAHANPAITLGLWSKQLIKTNKAVAYVAAQVLGGAVALASYQFLVNSTLNRPGANFDWRVFAAEALGAGIFGFGVAATINQKLKGGVQGAAVGISLMLGILMASVASEGLLNPAVAVGVDSVGWDYIVGPLVGALIGVQLYGAIFETKKKNVFSLISKKK